MSAQSLLEQLLKSGLDMVQGGKAMGAPASRAGGPAPAGRKTDWGTFAGGAATGGALGLLLGSKRGRHIGGKVLKVGSVAALGALAYKVYNQWQANQAQQAAGAAGIDSRSAGASAPSPGMRLPAPGPQPLSFERLSAPEVEHHSQAMLKAMIAAAKSDGHLDDRERGLLEAELNRLEADPALRRWLDDELRRPLDPAEVARAATSPDRAAEMYLASLLVADETSFMERAYLDELARQMQLPASLKQELEAQARAAA